MHTAHFPTSYFGNVLQSSDKSWSEGQI